MIRAEASNRLQPTADVALRPALPAQEITDKLSGLVVGQRLLAEIASLMPNGTYRALINQRNVTLALPFAAKSGDVIELEVAESDGKLTLAVVARPEAGVETAGNESAATNLSRTGQLISSLFAGRRDNPGAPLALPLNGNQPIAERPPSSGRDMVPLLQQAITHSGMFYESHQVEWVEGRYSTAQLLQEPQGKLAPQTPPGGQGQTVPSGVDSNTIATRRPAESGPDVSPGRPRPLPAGDAADLARPTGDASLPTRSLQVTVTANPPGESTQTGQTAPAASAAQPGQPVAPQVQAVVQQQLEAFATQNFAWQGQVWPGQNMHWEIEDGRERQSADDGDNATKWQTRLRLTLPNLGEVDARLHIQGKQVMVSMIAADPEARALLRSGAASLREQMERTGLDLASLGIVTPAENSADVQPAE